MKYLLITIITIIFLSVGIIFFVDSLIVHQMPQRCGFCDKYSSYATTESIKAYDSWFFRLQYDGIIAFWLFIFAECGLFYLMYSWIKKHVEITILNQTNKKEKGNC